MDRSGQPHGMTINSFTSVSLEPPLFLVCIDHRARVMPMFETGTALAVNFLTSRQQALSVKFARTGEDRFGALAWTAGVTGAPLIPECLAMIEGLVREMIVSGDHTILIIEAFGSAHGEGLPLVYYNSRYDRLGEPHV
jgi:flavin reductase (DIM6/NTAB) family NADH-FMN oxidoreductase RutF